MRYTVTFTKTPGRGRELEGIPMPGQRCTFPDQTTAILFIRAIQKKPGYSDILLGREAKSSYARVDE
jgi:hypothetical protein